MDKISPQDDLKPIFTKFRRMYFNDYHFIFMFLITFIQNFLFLKLIYRAFNQKGFQQKLVRLSLQCHLERDLKPILHDVYKMNIELEFIDYKLTRWEFLRAMVDSIGDHNTFELPTIAEEERWLCY